ncbi:hypothetical protein QWZ08_18400 [Ferruginibacter paludis]|uniref:hypothetical protein n=1 Tax=Ferruginibacter paludis TaxID=1310417 RepID=UPI0025B60D48|nr:hypothetical protein [Ferruginibacter paludis]MDN3657630.1 hypothetical protein [Ferruginibacter paludis]
MKKLFFPVLISVLISCNNNTKNALPATIAESAPAINEAKKDSFFPVTSFIRGQIRSFDSLLVTPLHTTVINDKTDSVWIKQNALIPLLKDFLSPEIKETNLTSFFKESSFNDQTLNAVTFTYDPVRTLPDSISLRHWDVYIDPESGKISKIYLVKQLKGKEGNITQQLTWKTNKWAGINTILNKPDGTSILLKAEKFIWNFTE